MRTRRLLFVIIMVALLVGACSGRQILPTPSATAFPDMLALVNGILIDGTGAEPVPDAVLLIQGERILAVGPRAEVSLPPGVRTLDLQGAAMLPGLINVHVHNTMGAGLLEQWAQAGVTTVRDVGAPEGFPIFNFRETAKLDPQKARLVAAGPLVTVPNGYPSRTFPALLVTSTEDARNQVNRLIDEGADLIKIALAWQAGPVLSQEEVTAIVSAAHGRGKPVAAHVGAREDVAKAITAGVDDIDHMPDITDEQLQELLDKGIYWVPTITLSAAGAQQFKKFVQQGGLVALGNDAGYLKGPEVGLPWQELVGLSWFKLTPLQIITIATLNGARLCRLDQDLGTLQAGKLADILVVNGDPSKDLSALTKVRLVIHSGVIIRSSEDS